MATTTRLLAAWALFSMPAVSRGQELIQGDWHLRYDAQAVVFHAERGGEVPYQGDSEEPLYGARFYDAVGRSDLAAMYRSRERAKSGTLVLAVLAAYASFPLMVDLDGSLRIQSSDPQDRAIAGAGMALGVGAVALATRAFTLHREPVSSAARHRLADDYNDRLREELGGTSEKASLPAAPEPPRFSLGVCPRATGGEVVLGASF